jgi:hypothetical protein
MSESPFVSLEAAHEYVSLLLEAVQQTRAEVAHDVDVAVAEGQPRRREALQLVAWKLERLEQQLAGSRRLMVDLRRLRRLLLGESEERPPADPPGSHGAVDWE